MLDSRHKYEYFYLYCKVCAVIQALASLMILFQLGHSPIAKYQQTPTMTGFHQIKKNPTTSFVFASTLYIFIFIYFAYLFYIIGYHVMFSLMILTLFKKSIHLVRNQTSISIQMIINQRKVLSIMIFQIYLCNKLNKLI